jgi:hypothetical protein
MIDLLKDKDVAIQTTAIEMLKHMAINKNPKLVAYLRTELFQRMAEMVNETIPQQIQQPSTPKKKRDRKKNDKGDAKKSEKTNIQKLGSEPVLQQLTPDQKAARERILSLWQTFVKTDVAILSLMVGRGLLPIFSKLIQSTDVEVVCCFMDCLKPFFTVASHQKEMIKEGLLDQLIEFTTSSNMTLQTKSFEVLFYFDEIHQPTMLQKGILNSLAQLLDHQNPKIRTKALEFVQYFDSKYQDQIVSVGTVKQLLDILALKDYNDTAIQSLILKALSVILHFDVSYQDQLIKEGLLESIITLLQTDNERIRLKVLAVVDYFLASAKHENQLVQAGLFKALHPLLDEQSFAVKIKAFETVSKLQRTITPSPLQKNVFVVLNTYSLFMRIICSFRTYKGTSSRWSVEEISESCSRSKY